MGAGLSRNHRKAVRRGRTSGRAGVRGASLHRRRPVGSEARVGGAPVRGLAVAPTVSGRARGLAERGAMRPSRVRVARTSRGAASRRRDGPTRRQRAAAGLAAVEVRRFTPDGRSGVPAGLIRADPTRGSGAQRTSRVTGRRGCSRSAASCGPLHRTGRPRRGCTLPDRKTRLPRLEGGCR